MTTHSITSTGWTGWDEIVRLLGGDRCLWTDLGGLHHSTAPVRLPVGATHLWAWRPDRWVRVRIDSGRVLATVLTPDAAGTPVVVVESDGIAWGNHKRARECHLQVTLLRTEGPAPITFVKAAEPTAQAA